MSIKKQFLKSKNAYKVTWTVDKATAGEAEHIHLSGDFNNWSKSKDEFTKLKSGSFKYVLELPKDQSFQFRYLVDREKWLNDEAADSYVDNQVSNELNCVISL